MLVDNEDTTHVDRTGTWTVQDKGGYGPSWLLHESSEQGDSARVVFRPEISSPGNYDTYVYFPQPSLLTSSVNLSITNGDQTENKAVAREDIRVEGQTSGEWVHVGQQAVRDDKELSVSIIAGEGKVTADAVLFIPK